MSEITPTDFCCLDFPSDRTNDIEVFSSMLIFNFHYVEPVPMVKSREHITISVEGLRNFIRTMRRLGFTPVCLREVLSGKKPELLRNRKAIILTFDDGYENFYEHAVPVLEAEECPSTVFALAGSVAGTNHWDQGHLPRTERDRLMSLEQLKALANSPLVSIGSHGLKHLRFSMIDEETLRQEIYESYRILSEMFPESFVPALAYPWGSYNEQTLLMIKDSPYKAAFTVEKGRWTEDCHPHAIPRFSIYYRDRHPWVLLSKLLRNNLLFK